MAQDNLLGGVAGQALVGVLNAVSIVVVALLGAAAAAVFYLLTRPLLKKALVVRRVPVVLASACMTAYRRFFWLAAPLFGLYLAGVDAALLVGAATVVLVAAGLAGHRALENYVAGLWLASNKAFYLGDTIEAGGVRGRVVEMTLHDTHLRTEDNRYVVVPNRVLLEKPLTNHSKPGAVRVSVAFCAPPGTDLDALEKSVLQKVKKLSSVERSPPPCLAILSLEDGSAKLALQAWTKKDEASVRQRLTRALYNAAYKVRVQDTKKNTEKESAAAR